MDNKGKTIVHKIQVYLQESVDKKIELYSIEVPWCVNESEVRQGIKQAKRVYKRVKNGKAVEKCNEFEKLMQGIMYENSKGTNPKPIYIMLEYLRKLNGWHWAYIREGIQVIVLDL